MRAVKDAREEPLSGTAGGHGRGYALFQLRMKTLEVDKLHEKLEERARVLESLKQRQDDLHRNFEETLASQRSYDVFLKGDESKKVAGKAEREREEVLQKEIEIKRIERECSEVMEKKEELLGQLQRHSVYKDFMDHVCKLTKFRESHALLDHLDRLLHVKQQLWETASGTQEAVDRQRRAAALLEDQHNVFMLQRNNQLFQLQRQLETACSEALEWEKRWNHIEETAAEKTLTLGQIKMATLNLYEMMGAVIGEGGVHMTDTERQLDQIAVYLEDYAGIVKQHNLQKTSAGNKGDNSMKPLL